MKNLMKIPIGFWIVLAVVAAYYIGRHIERSVMLQTEVGELKERVHQLEASNMRSEEKWGWISKIGSKIPFINRLF